jgi:hypothetical protein
VARVPGHRHAGRVIADLRFPGGYGGSGPGHGVRCDVDIPGRRRWSDVGADRRVRRAARDEGRLPRGPAQRAEPGGHRRCPGAGGVHGERGGAGPCHHLRHPGGGGRSAG